MLTLSKFLIPDSSTQSISPSTTMGGHQYIPVPCSTEHLNSQQQVQHQLSSSTLILGSNQSNFQLHQHQQNVEHQNPSPPEIGSTTTMWEDIASSIKKLDPDHADVLLVASSNVLIPSNSTMAHISGIPTQHNNLTSVGGEPPQMIVTSISDHGDTHLMQEQQDCNNYVITSLPNNNGSSMCLLPSSNNQLRHLGPTLINSGGISDNNFNQNVSSMVQASATTDSFSSMSFDSTTASTNACVSSFESTSPQQDTKEGIITMESATLPSDQEHHSHLHIPHLNGRHCQHPQQHDINQNPSNPSSAITSSPASTPISYQQINPLIVNQSSHSHHHPPHSNQQHHIQFQSNANISSLR